MQCRNGQSNNHIHANKETNTNKYNTEITYNPKRKKQLVKRAKITQQYKLITPQTTPKEKATIVKRLIMKSAPTPTKQTAQSKKFSSNLGFHTVTNGSSSQW